jgi:hypothetical protein
MLIKIQNGTLNTAQVTRLLFVLVCKLFVFKH